jgi:Cu/Ag efflux protein CusF
MSETDDQTPRRPPTIELAATEVDDATDKPAAGGADAGTTGTAEHATAGSNAPASALSGRRFTSHIASALIGAVVMAAVAAALWVTGVIPSRETTPVGTAASDMSAPTAPSNPAPNPPPRPPPSPTDAQNGPVAADMAARLDKIERAIEAQRSDPALGSRIAELAAQTKALADNLAALTRRVDETAATAQSVAKQADAALNTAEAAKSTSEAASKIQVRHEDVDALASRILALESAVKGLAAVTAPLTSSGANDRAARLTIAAEALRAAVERGAPYQTNSRP